MVGIAETGDLGSQSRYEDDLDNGFTDTGSGGRDLSVTFLHFLVRVFMSISLNTCS